MFSFSDLQDLAKERWYYEIELANGLTTQGHRHGNIAVVRDFLRRVDLAGKTCLDIGTQEFVSPVLMVRQGAARVDAYDRLSLENRYAAIKQVYDVDFEYFHGMRLNDLKAALERRGKAAVYDFVNFSGVIYHMVDPLAGLAMARSFLRHGGIMLIETAVKRTKDFVVAFNEGGRLYPGSNYFLPSIPTLDYWIRMLRMQAIDCAWWGPQDVCRLLVICRGASGVLAEPGDEWMTSHWIRQDLVPFGLVYEQLESREAEVGYRSTEHSRRAVRGNGTLDLFANVQQSPAYPLNQDLIGLRLRDRY